MPKFAVILFSMIVAIFSAASAAAEQTSALIGQAMDKQLPGPDMHFNGTLPQLIQQFGELTGVRIEADDLVYNTLPWGDLTTFQASFRRQTLRQALSAVCEKLGLRFELEDQAVELHPAAALVRTGRRCTVDELAALDLLSHTPLDSKETTLPAFKLLEEIDGRLLKSPFAVENRAFKPADTVTINIPRDRSLAAALNEIALQTDATWYPWGKTVVVLKKTDQIHMQLSRRIDIRFVGQDVADVLLDLSRRAAVPFAIEPGAFQKIPAQFRTIRLTADNATIQQTLESIDGFTGLAYSVTNDGVAISFAPPASTQP